MRVVHRPRVPRCRQLRVAQAALFVVVEAAQEVRRVAGLAQLEGLAEHVGRGRQRAGGPLVTGALDEGLRQVASGDRVVTARAGGSAQPGQALAAALHGVGMAPAAHQVLGLAVTLVGGPTVPLDRLLAGLPGLLAAPAVPVEPRQPVLGRGVALVGGPTVPGGRFGPALCDALAAGLEHTAQLVLRAGVALRRGRAAPLGHLGFADIHFFALAWQWVVVFCKGEPIHPRRR